MPQEELTGQRPNNYSLWHRTQNRGRFEGVPGPPSWCWMNDGDWFEQRVRHKNGPLVIAAYIETIQIERVDRWAAYPIFPAKEKMGMDISARMKIPFYLVYHNADCTDFCVKSYLDGTITRKDRDKYIQFLTQL